MSLNQPLFYALTYVAVLYLRPHEFIPFMMDWPLLPISLALATLLWIGVKTKNFTAPQFRLVPMLTFMMGWSVTMSGWLLGGFSAISAFFPIALMFAILATTVDSVAKLQTVFKTLGVTMIIIAVHCIDQEATGVGWTGAEVTSGRATYIGFLNDPNDLSMTLLMALPMVLYLARRAGWFMRLFWWVGVLAIMDALKLANSRGAVLALGAMLFQYGLFRYGAVRSLLVVPFLLAPLLVLGPSRMNEMSADEESAEGRIDAWYAGFQMLKEHPLFGVGTGQFVDHNPLTAHNSFVLALCEQGVVGYYFWLSIIVVTWTMALKVQKAGLLLPGAPPPVQSEWAETHEASRTLWYGFTGALVCMFFLSRSYVPFFYFHMALMVAMYQLAQKQRADIAPVHFEDRWGKLLLFTLATVVILRIVTAFLS